MYDNENVPSVETYVSGFKKIVNSISSDLKLVLKAHYRIPSRKATCEELAAIVGFQNGKHVQNLYGTVGHALSDAIGFRPELRQGNERKWWQVWFIGHRPPGKRRRTIREMRTEVAEAIRELGWVEPTASISEEEFRLLIEERRSVASELSHENLSVAVSRSDPYPPRISVTRDEFQRSQDVVEWILRESKGICEKCHSRAPFSRSRNGQPYLEVHHVKPLSAGGSDTIQNTVALCPNCHREVHYGENSESINEHLLSIATQHGE